MKDEEIPISHQSTHGSLEKTFLQKIEISRRRLE
jgi:hypothetical protein